MSKDFIVFLTRLLKTWVFWASAIATVIFWLLALWAEAPISIPSPLASFVIYILLIVAAFQVWSKEHRQVAELQGEDANISLEPIPAPGMIEFTLPKDYSLVPNVVPPEIRLYVKFWLSNQGMRTGFLNTVEMRTQQGQVPSQIVFRPMGLYQTGTATWGTPVSLPTLLEPGEGRKVFYVVSAKVDRTDPEAFAQEFGKLSDFPATMTWTFAGARRAESAREVAIRVQFEEIKTSVFSHWKQEGREDLVEIAQEAGSSTGQA